MSAANNWRRQLENAEAERPDPFVWEGKGPKGVRAVVSEHGGVTISVSGLQVSHVLTAVSDEALVELGDWLVNVFGG